MARFFDVIGYGEQVETRPGVWTEVVTERKLMGDILRNTRQVREGENLNDDLTVQNTISVVADAYANEHYFAIKYVKWGGVRWKVDDVSVEPPRLVMRLGRKYNGSTPSPSP